jgi:hypothetical protein
MTLEVRLKTGVVGTDLLKTSLAERVRETTKLRGVVVFVTDIPEGKKKIEDRREWERIEKE